MSSSIAPRKVVVVVYEYFYPGYMAGGPIQSLTNVICELGVQYEFKVITSAFDLTSSSPYPEVKLNAWNQVKLPCFDFSISVWYNSTKTIGIFKTFRLVNQAKGDFLYLNGLFSSWTTFPVVLKRVGLLNSPKVIVAPRGMLQGGALRVKPQKKKLYLTLMKALTVFHNVRWHATDEEEKKSIEMIVDHDTSIIVASNIPKRVAERKERSRGDGLLRLIFLSLITEKKNLHLVLQALTSIKTRIQFHIYGPVKDTSYWQMCQKLIRESIHDIQYFGPIVSSQVQSKLAEYDVMVLPSKGENFGHAIYEALSVGTPVIIGKHTPWGRVQDMSAGVTVETENIKELTKAISYFEELTDAEYSSLSTGAHSLAANYFRSNDFKAQYEALFS